jgi:DNA replication licensing factor MCM2
MYDCTKCGYTLGPFSQNGEAEIQVGACPQCQSKGPFQVSHPQLPEPTHFRK